MLWRDWVTNLASSPRSRNKSAWDLTTTQPPFRGREGCSEAHLQGIFTGAPVVHSILATVLPGVTTHLRDIRRHSLKQPGIGSDDIMADIFDFMDGIIAGGRPVGREMGIILGKEKFVLCNTSLWILANNREASSFFRRGLASTHSCSLSPNDRVDLWDLRNARASFFTPSFPCLAHEWPGINLWKAAQCPLRRYLCFLLNVFGSFWTQWASLSRAFGLVSMFPKG